MKTLVRSASAWAILLLLGGVAQAQYRSNYGRERDSREPLNYVRADLDRAGRDMFYLSGRELKRLNHVREQIAGFQAKWEVGRFDRHELNDVIRSLQSVVDKNRLEPRDRDRLLDDLSRLCAFRASGGFVGDGPRSSYR